MARADVYLSALYGVQSLGVDTLFEYSSVIGAIGPAIRLPVFSEGRLEGAYRNARAEYDLAAASRRRPSPWTWRWCRRSAAA